MGVLEVLLVIAIGLKMAGVAFLSVGYLQIVGAYLLSVLLVFVSVLLFISVSRKLGDK